MQEEHINLEDEENTEEESKLTHHIQLGAMSTLRVDRITEPGIFLMAGDEEDVLLPNAYITPSMEVDDLIEVFIYTDSEDRLVATTETPYAMVDQFAYLEVVDTASIGAFLDWGLLKDLYVPKNQQKEPFEVGQRRIIRIVEDTNTDRLYGVERISRFLKKDHNDLVRKQEVSILVYARTPLGYKVIINHSHEGMLFHNEIFEDIYVGDTKKAYIKTLREDGKIDLSLQPIGARKVLKGSVENILLILKENGGKMNFTYKSDAKKIQDIFGVSKKVYKKSLTELIEKKKIVLGEDFIALTQ